MAVQPIRLFGDPVLRQRAIEVDSFDKELQQLVADLTDTMLAAPGAGLAAPQIGVGLRVFTMDANRDPEAPRAPLVLVNPEVTWASDTPNTYEEGCLSIPDQYGEVTRPAQIRMRWLGLDGKTHEREFDELWATCAQHELDHLDGVLFIDHLSAIKRQMITRKMVKLKRDLARA